MLEIIRETPYESYDVSAEGIVEFEDFELKLQVWETSLVVQILDMDEDLRNKVPEDVFELTRASNGWKFITSDFPEIDPDFKQFFMRGYVKSKNLDVTTAHFKTKEEAEQCKQEIIEAIGEFSPIQRKIDIWRDSDGKVKAGKN